MYIKIIKEMDKYYLNLNKFNFVHTIFIDNIYNKKKLEKDFLS
jgi:hypothetical protein